MWDLHCGGDFVNLLANFLIFFLEELCKYSMEIYELLVILMI